MERGPIWTAPPDPPFPKAEPSREVISSELVSREEAFEFEELFEEVGEVAEDLFVLEGEGEEGLESPERTTSLRLIFTGVFFGGGGSRFFFGGLLFYLFFLHVRVYQ